MYIIRKTGNGKSLVLLGSASILCGIIICVVPLIGLGSDQAMKSNNKEFGIEAWRLDEFKGKHQSKLKERLELYLSSDKSRAICCL